MYRINTKIRFRICSLCVALATVFTGAALSGSCFSGTASVVCERSGLRCGPGLACTIDQDACIPPGGCGDGLTADGEACDDGNVRDGDGCSADCTSDETCGNGIVDTKIGESCDGGANCSSSCILERCGNGVVDENEQCDSGEQDSAGCNKNCTFARCGDGYLNSAAGEKCDSGGEITAGCNGLLCTIPTCGDGFYNPIAGEVCDTGGNDTAACDDDCTVPVCGDGHTNINYVIPETDSAPAHAEQCDDGVLGASGVPTPRDSKDCDSDCTLARCGDGHKNDLAGEQCDDGAGNDDNRKDACRTSCRKASCGDRVIDSGEMCDDGNHDNSDGCPDGPRGTCKQAVCGDGFVRTGVELCDDGNHNNSDDCPDGPGGTCMPATCGDGFLEIAVEVCDKGGNGRPQTCTGGKTCNADCTACL